MKPKNVFASLNRLQTESRNPRSRKIDTAPVGKILRLMNREDRRVAEAVRHQLPSIGKAIEMIVKAFKSNGRLLYVGAGTSGRLGIVDASECPPTFGTDPQMVQGIIAGGRGAVFQSVEGAEDRDAEGAGAMTKAKVGRRDVVCGIAASSRTPYVLAALTEAKRRGAKTIFVTTNPRHIVKKSLTPTNLRMIDTLISVDVGPEVIMGSTRLKSGTAQKMVLNMLTTTSMIRMGKVYENMMIDLKMNSKKLEERAKKVVMFATGLDYDAAGKLLKVAKGHVKTAIVMSRRRVSVAEARRLLRKSGGFVRPAIEI